MDAAKRQRFQDVSKKLKNLFQRYGTSDVPASVRDEMMELNDELSGLVDDEELGSAKRRRDGLDRWFNEPASPMIHPGGGAPSSRGGKSIGEAFVESDAFKHWDPGAKSGPGATLGFKALLDETAWVPQAIRIPRIEPSAQRPLGVIDVFAQGATGESSVAYLEETTYTSTAAETAEGALKPEAALAFTERTSPVRTIATFLPVTNQLMEDAPAAQDYVNQRLAFMVRARLDNQLLNGNGTAPNLRGILNVVGIQTQAKGVDPTPDAIQRAMDLVRVTGRAEPDAVILHPNDWQSIRLLRTADGIYIWGSPADTGAATIWGKPVVVTDAIAEGTGLVGAFQTEAMVFFRHDLKIAVSDSHSDFFVRNQLAIRAEMRVALVTFRAAAFCTVTGI